MKERCSYRRIMSFRDMGKHLCDIQDRYEESVIHKGMNHEDEQEPRPMIGDIVELKVLYSRQEEGNISACKAGNLAASPSH